MFVLAADGDCGQCRVAVVARLIVVDFLTNVQGCIRIFHWRRSQVGIEIYIKDTLLVALGCQMVGNQIGNRAHPGTGLNPGKDNVVRCFRVANQGPQVEHDFLHFQRPSIGDAG